MYNELHYEGNCERLQHGRVMALPGELERGARLMRRVCAAGRLCWATALVSHEERRHRWEAPRRLLEIFFSPLLWWLRTQNIRTPSSRWKHPWTYFTAACPPAPIFQRAASCIMKKYIRMCSPPSPHLPPSNRHPSCSGNKAPLQSWAPISKNSLQRKGRGYFWKQNYRCWVRVFAECHVPPPKENRSLITHLSLQCFLQRKLELFFVSVTIGTETLGTWALCHFSNDC